MGARGRLKTSLFSDATAPLSAPRFSPWLAARQPYSDARRSGEVQAFFSPPTGVWSSPGVIHAFSAWVCYVNSKVVLVGARLYIVHFYGTTSRHQRPRIPRKYTSGQAATLKSRAKRAILFRCRPGPASSRALNHRVTLTLKSIASNTSNTCITGNTFLTRLVRKVKQ